MRTALLLASVLLQAATASALTIEAERARVRTIGGPAEGGWNLWSNGELGDHVRIAQAGAYQVVVRARGTPAQGVWPRMDLVIDGTARQTVDVSRPDFADYPFSVELGAGAHSIAVGFTNDAMVGGEDRNLYLDRIEIRPPAGAPDPTLAAAEELAMEAQKQEDAVLAKSRQAIEQNRKTDTVLRVIGPDGKPVAGAAVTADLARHDFLFGCNIFMFDRFDTPEKNAAYKQRFADLLNYATLPFYWRGYERERGKPNYPNTDKLVAWCTEHGIRMKGHPLLWDHEAARPTWTNNQQPPPDVQRQRVVDILTRYRGKIELWEVVNEPSHVRGVKIDQTYRWARETDPKAYLIVNDYYVMANGYPPFFDLLKQAIADGVPFDGIGIQAHEPRTMRFPLDQVQRVLDHYATLGKDLHITEFTPTSGGQPITGSHLKGVWDEAAQADYGAKFYTVCFAHPAAMGITWWDLCEQGAWLPGGGMLHKDLTPKPVYEALMKLIHGAWHTRAEGKTDAAGRFPFRGFYGTYTVEAGGKKATVQLKKGGERELTVIVQ